MKIIEIDEYCETYGKEYLLKTLKDSVNFFMNHEIGRDKKITRISNKDFCEEDNLESSKEDAEGEDNFPKYIKSLERSELHHLYSGKDFLMVDEKNILCFMEINCDRETFLLDEVCFNPIFDMNMIYTSLISSMKDYFFYLLGEDDEHTLKKIEITSSIMQNNRYLDFLCEEYGGFSYTVKTDICFRFFANCKDKDVKWVIVLLHLHNFKKIPEHKIKLIVYREKFHEKNFMESSDIYNRNCDFFVSKVKSKIYWCIFDKPMFIEVRQSGDIFIDLFIDKNKWEDDDKNNFTKRLNKIPLIDMGVDTSDGYPRFILLYGIFCNDQELNSSIKKFPDGFPNSQTSFFNFFGKVLNGEKEKGKKLKTMSGKIDPESIKENLYIERQIPAKAKYNFIPHVEKIPIVDDVKCLCQHIYLLREREFISQDKDIYKIGKSRNVSNRMSQYPKGSEVCFILKVEDCDTSEKILLKIFSSKFKQRKDIGTEYYEGDHKEMIKIIYEKCL